MDGETQGDDSPPPTECSTQNVGVELTTKPSKPKNKVQRKNPFFQKHSKNLDCDKFQRKNPFFQQHSKNLDCDKLQRKNPFFQQQSKNVDCDKVLKRKLFLLKEKKSCLKVHNKSRENTMKKLKDELSKRSFLQPHEEILCDDQPAAENDSRTKKLLRLHVSSLTTRLKSGGIEIKLLKKQIEKTKSQTEDFRTNMAILHEKAKLNQKEVKELEEEMSAKNCIRPNQELTINDSTVLTSGAKGKKTRKISTKQVTVGPVACVICKKNYKNKNSLKKHKSMAHRNGDSNLLECVCGKHLSRNNMAKHVKVCKGLKATLPEK
jgi:hypothetical protein